MRLTTRRLLLRPVVIADRRALHDQVYGNDQVMRWLPGGVPLRPERCESILAALDRHWADHAYGVWTVTERRTGFVIGQCGLRQVPELGVVELLYALGPGHWGRGYATEAARAVVHFAAARTSLRRLVAFTKPGNSSSEAVLRKCAFLPLDTVRVFGLEATAWARALAARRRPPEGGWAGASSRRRSPTPHDRSEHVARDHLEHASGGEIRELDG